MRASCRGDGAPVAGSGERVGAPDRNVFVYRL
jgi:hypothetical protein